jgi:O-acetyl-ADP-ribose deacetylase (regulator of RNase III)
MLEFTQGDMFEAKADIRVNTVNCVGVMGAGVALAFKQRYPEMFKEYQHACKSGQVRPGHMHVWKSLSGDWIVNFPTKRDWREPSRYEDIDAGLDDLRRYLSTVGGVTVALPALGCGHGGLDWARVSGMIRDKLDGVDAHVLIFEPAASHRVGRSALAAPTNDERARAEKLGYQLVESDRFPISTPAYVLGKLELLSSKWIAVLPSRAPAEREIHALKAVASELVRWGSGATVALVHGTHASEEIAELFADHGINTVLVLPFGVLTRKSVAKPSAINRTGALTLASTAPANAKWSRQLFAQAMDMLRANSEAVLLSDPDTEWLTNKDLSKWAHIPISYIRYETTSPRQRAALASVGAKPIGRRSEDGTPNIDHLNIGLKNEPTSNPTHSKMPLLGQTEAKPDSPAPLSCVEDDEVLTLDLSHPSQAVRQEMFEILMRLDVLRLAFTVRLPDHKADADLLRLRELVFSSPKRD